MSATETPPIANDRLRHHSLHRLVSLPLRDIASEMDAMMNTLDKHHRLAAEVRYLLYNDGAGPNLSQLKRCDVMLREIAGLPSEQANSVYPTAG